MLKRSVPYIGNPTYSPDAVYAFGHAPRPCLRLLCGLNKGPHKSRKTDEPDDVQFD